MADGFLIKQEKYLEAGIHIGTKLRVIDMRRFIYRTRNDGLYVLDLRKVDERIRMAGKLLAKYDPKDVVVVASRTYSSAAATKFSQITGAKVLAGRFIPGRFTNAARDDFVEPKLVIICDPKGEHQAVVEAGKCGVPTIGLCDTDNFTTFIDWVIPCNNKGRRSLSLIFWLMAREMAVGSGKIGSYDDFKPSLEEFEAVEAEKPAEAPTESAEAVVVGAEETTPATVEAADDDGSEEQESNEEEGPSHEPGAGVEAPEEKEEAKEGAEKKAPAKKKAPSAKKAPKKEEKKAE